MRGKELKDYAHNEALIILDKLIHDLEMNYADIRFFADSLAHELKAIKNFKLANKGIRIREEKAKSKHGKVSKHKS